MKSSVARVFGTGINLVGAVSPATGGALAFWLFSRTGSREPKSEKEKAVLAEAAPLMRQAHDHVIPLSNSAAIAHEFPTVGQPSGHRILVTHGWDSSAAFIHGLINGLRETGAVVVALDLPGHGAAPGRRLHAPMAVEAISRTFERLGPFNLMVGHSFGGYMTVASVRGVLPDLPVPQPEKIVTIASPSDVRAVFAKYVKMLGLSDTVHKALICRIEKISGRKVEEFYGPDLLAKTAVQALILHAEDDKEVDARAARQYAESGPHVRLKWLNGLGHRRIVNSREVINAITNFVG